MTLTVLLMTVIQACFSELVHCWSSNSCCVHQRPCLCVSRSAFTMSTTPTSKQLVDMGLKPGANTIVFDVYGKRDVSEWQVF